jgi:uncharacterized protein YlxW (UPF0749 family)
MNAQAIIERKAQLERERDQVQANLNQLQANLNAYQGAIEDCEYWLEQVTKEETE